MIVVLMRVENVLHRLFRNTLDLRHDVSIVALVHIVDQRHAFIGHQHRHVAAIARNHVKIILHLLRAQRSRSRVLLISREPSCNGKRRSEDSKCGGVFHSDAFHATQIQSAAVRPVTNYCRIAGPLLASNLATFISVRPACPASVFM